MLLTLLYKFIAAWVLGIIALLLGRFVKPSNAQFPPTIKAKLLAYLKVWFFVFLAQLFFGYVAYLINYSNELDKFTYFEFLMPIIAGAIFARQLVKKPAHVA